MKRNRSAQVISPRMSKPRAWLSRALCHGTILAGIAANWPLASNDAFAQEPLKPGSTKLWKSSGPWRAIGIAPRKPSAQGKQGVHQIHGFGLVRAASTEAPVTKPTDDSQAALAQAQSALESTGVVNAIATDPSREPSLVKVPSVKVPSLSSDELKPKQILTPGEQADDIATDMQTSRSIGAKVRLSMSTVFESTSQSIGSADTNSSNLKVTRSGDITAETPVKVNFNQQRILALPALPSPSSPYAESGIEIPVRVEAVEETAPSILNTQAPTTELPSIGVLPAPEMELQIPQLPALPPTLDVPTLDVPTLEEPMSQESSVVEPTRVESETQELRAVTQAIQTPEESLDHLQPVVEYLPETLAESNVESSDGSEHQKASSNGPVSAAPTIVPLPSIEATDEEIQAISNLSRSTQTKSDGVLSQPGAAVLITTGPLVNSVDVEPDENISLETQDIRALQVNGTITRLHIVDSSVCQVVCNGNRLFVVADQTGETTIEVNMGKLHKPMYVKVVVQRPWARSSAASVSLDQMHDIVSRLAPTADVSVQPTEEGSLVISGFADNKQQAKKVLEAIRKMVLVPVIDKLEIR
jgi:hypothetical protein